MFGRSDNCDTGPFGRSRRHQSLDSNPAAYLGGLCRIAAFVQERKFEEIGNRDDARVDGMTRAGVLNRCPTVCEGMPLPYRAFVKRVKATEPGSGSWSSSR
jgi:hypothetical protein